jgi:hypothetical protein
MGRVSEHMYTDLGSVSFGHVVVTHMTELDTIGLYCNFYAVLKNI